ncbi:MAG TPA: fibrobacter succinogenes major paralogous domain-containing protein, partial [Methylococcales bacterium]
MKNNVVHIVSGCLLISGMVLFNSCKKDAVIPTLTTTDITNITVNSLVSGGSITKDGGATVTARGVVYGTTSGPVVGGNQTTDDAGVGSFVSTLTGLTPNTLYYIRAYATNSAGTAYGNEITATTTPIVLPTLTTVDVSSITLTSAISGGNITADGNDAITARGVCWTTTTGPTIDNNKTTDATGTGSFTSDLTGLQAGVAYFVRAYATNSAGTAYGNEISFTTTAVAIPTLVTSAVTSITLTSAVSGGNITADGGGSVTARGVCWNTVTGPTLANSKTSNGTGTGSFVSNLTGLTGGTTYYVRAYATNAAGTAYGNEIIFTTNPLVIPTLTTTAVSAITATTAASGGSISSDGGSAVTARGVCWAITASPTILNSKTTDGTGTGPFTSTLTGLLPVTVYHIRAYATNTTGTAYGSDVSFTTPVGAPLLTTSPITLIDLTTATSGGTISSDGGGAITAKGVCWATTANPTTADSKTTDGTGTASFVSNLISLTTGTNYYVRAYATNSAGTAYGNQVIFNTNYKSVTIGTQVWMAENLKTILYNDNTAIPLITDATLWMNATGPAYCWYANDETTNKPLYGAIYNWFAVSTGKLCPTGWHVPSDAEYMTLETTLGMVSGTLDGQLGAWGWRGTDQGSQMKNTTGWAAGMNGTNTSGWSALPGGYRSYSDGVFNNVGDLSYWWTSDSDPTNATYRRLDGSNNGV